MVLNPSPELIKAALSQSMEAHKHNQHHYITKKQHGAGSSSSSPSTEVLIIAFPATWEADDWCSDRMFGETDVDHTLFPSLRRIGENRPAKVNGAFLQRFHNLLGKSQFKTEVQKALMEDRRNILLTGHSSGGAIASFATLWILENYIRKLRVEVPIGCVTFGSPLMGDRTVCHAVRREKWVAHFTHFVMEHDIVPRVMLAPNMSVQEHLPRFLKFCQQKVKASNHKPHKFPKFLDKVTRKRPIGHDQSVEDHQAVAFFENVMYNASAVASNAAFDLMEPTGSLMEKLSVDFVKISPYRPFGNHIFCTQDKLQDPVGPRSLLVVENSNAVLQLLFYFCQLPAEDQNLAEFALKSLTENLSYEELQEDGFLVNLKDLNNHLLTPNGTTGDAVRTSNTALSDLSVRARLCLLAAEEAEKRKKENERQMHKLMRKLGPEQKRPKGTQTEQKNIENILNDIREYKEKHANGKMGYYDAFKCQDEHRDFTANMNRLELAKIWDEVVEMVIREDLPDEFEGREEWVDLGTEFRRLVEPLDIANYYRHLKGEGYMGFRPKRYKFTQRWYEHANTASFGSISESNFTAEVEELKKDVEKPGSKFEDIKERVESIEKQVLKWVFEDKILGKDVFLEESTFCKWWKQLPYDHRARSVLRDEFSKT